MIFSGGRHVLQRFWGVPRKKKKKERKCKILKSGTNWSFLGIIENTARDHAKGITIEYQ